MHPSSACFGLFPSAQSRAGAWGIGWPLMSKSGNMLVLCTDDRITRQLTALGDVDTTVPVPGFSGSNRKAGPHY